MKEAFISKRLQAKTIALIEQANAIIEYYMAMGYALTVRQLHYQFVGKNLYENIDRNYKRLSRVMTDGRLVGLVDWDGIEDRTRYLRQQPRIETAQDALQVLLDQWVRNDTWRNQEYRVEVWTEKEALIGIIAQTCNEFDVPYRACKGYDSTSGCYEAHTRHTSHPTVILHIGDHDPSGLNMTEDIRKRMQTFNGCLGISHVERIALNMDQIEGLEEDPNPVKQKDSRAREYVKKYGPHSWELDALPPEQLVDLIRSNIRRWIDEELWAERVEEFKVEHDQLSRFAAQLT